MMRHLKAGARKKCTVKRSSGNPERKRIRNRVPRPSANNVARTPSCVGPWESFELSCARFASLRPSFIVLSFLWLLLFSDARSSSSPPIAAIKERKRSQKERGTQRGGSRKRESERDKKRDEKEERDRLFSSPSWTSPCSLSRLDVIKTKPRAGPPSRRLINCFVRDTSLFKRNRALLSPLSSSLTVLTTLRTPHIRTTRTCLYSVLEPAFFSQRHNGGIADIAIWEKDSIPPVLSAGSKAPHEKEIPTVAGANEKVDRPFCTKSTDVKATF